MDFEVAFSGRDECVLALMGLPVFLHSRCLQDNNWDYTRSAQAFTHLKVRFRNTVAERRGSVGLQEGQIEIALMA